MAGQSCFTAQAYGIHFYSLTPYCQLIVPGAENGTIPSMLRTVKQSQARRVVVGNIHVLFNPKRGDIKLGQCRAFLEQAHHFSEIWQGASVVIGGDFNSTPSSAVYKYMATSELDLSNLDRRFISGQLGEERCSLSRVVRGQRRLKESLGYLQKKGAVVLKGTEAFDNVNEEETEGELSTTTMGMEGSGNFSASIRYMDARQEGPDGVTENSNTNEAPSTEGDDEDGTWCLEELRVATGREGCTHMQHNLNLRSAYSDIQGCVETRDDTTGEPLLTTCHRNFTGTVDYIWCNDGLKTMRVLDTVPLKAFLRDKGLPVKVWGSDHLALACELAFT